MSARQFPLRAVPAADAAGGETLGAVKGGQQPPVKPVDDPGEDGIEVLRRRAVEHAADVVVGRQPVNAEQGPGVGPALAGLELRLRRQEGRALQEEDGEGRHADVGHLQAGVGAGPAVRGGRAEFAHVGDVSGQRGHGAALCTHQKFVQMSAKTAT